jgi:hypothetical protein
MTDRPVSTREGVSERVMTAQCPQKLRRTLLLGVGARNRRDQMTTGERVLYGPNNEPIRVLGYENGSVAVEHGDHRHVVVRPRPVAYDLKRKEPPPSLLRSILRSKR